MNINSKIQIVSSYLIFAAMLAAAAHFLSGCASSSPRVRPIPLTLIIKPAGQAADLTIPVYIGAANSMYDKGWMEGDVDQILEKVRANESVDFFSFQLTPGGTNILRTDPKWSLWIKRKRDHVVVIADLPKNFGGESGRRLLIPLDKRLWRHLSSKKIVNVEIHEKNGVKLLDTPGF